MKILLAEDDERLGKVICHLLGRESYQVDWVKNGRDAYEYATLSSYDVMVLDWMMPKMDGIEVCRKLRNDGYQGTILFLTAKDALEEVVTGLDAGADDYLIKPFEFEELLARVRALFRRKKQPFQQVLSLGNLSLDLGSHVIKLGDETIELTKKEYQLLEILLRNKNQVLSREQLIDYVWGFDAHITDNSLDALVKLVRKKIDEKNRPSKIKTIRGVGYTMCESHV